MKMLYDSDAFVVVHMNAAAADENNAHNADLPPRDCFEIVDKRSNRSLCLVGPWAEAFEAQIQRWQEETPEQEEVETILNNYAILAQNPLVIH